MEDVPQAEVSKEFFKSFRAGSTAFIIQRCVNRNDRFLVINEYSRGGRRNVIPKGQEGKSWPGWVVELCNIVDSLVVSDDGR
jgi:hypothetical protein